MFGLALVLFMVMLWSQPDSKSKFHLPRQEQERRPIQMESGSGVAWERKVLAQLRGDRVAMERLIAYQARRNPRASRAELLQQVYDDYVRDQR